MHNYSATMSARCPGLICFLLDTSLSMAEPYFEGTSKAEFAAQGINKAIAELINRCINGDEIRDRCFLSVISYGESDRGQEAFLNEHVHGLVSDVAAKVGDTVEIQVFSMGSWQEEQPVWVKPRARGRTPMDKAFDAIYDLCKLKLSEEGMENAFPPIVVNITDGAPNSYAAASKAAERLRNLGTNDGNVLLFNVHIAAATEGKEILYPASDDLFRHNQFASFLFSISSPLPPPLMRSARQADCDPQPGARGFLFNASPSEFLKLLIFASTPQ